MRAEQFCCRILCIGACIYIACARDGFVDCALYAYRTCARWFCSIVRVSIACVHAFILVNATDVHA
jgi:hypothetical protein